MSVPLDRLYSFLQDVGGSDILIYRYLPHGSKKIMDIQSLDDTVTGMDRLVKIPVLCHDQEPLDATLLSSALPRFLHHLMSCPSNFHSKTIIIHSEKNSKYVTQLKSMCNPVYYWSHALIAQDWFRYAQHDKKLLVRDCQKTFLVYGRAWSGSREYRLKFFDLLISQNLVQHCNTSFNPVDDIHYHAHKFHNMDFVPKNVIENFLNKNTHPSWASADYCTEDYQQTAVEIVLETLFDDERLHLTEKSLRPIACGQPFLLAASQHSLEYLRSYGFLTFDPFIDETYDTLAKPLDRLHAIMDAMAKIQTCDHKNSLFKDIREIASFNRRHFFSEDFTGHVLGELKSNFFSAINTSKTVLDFLPLKRYLTIFGLDGYYTKTDICQALNFYLSRTK